MYISTTIYHYTTTQYSLFQTNKLKHLMHSKLTISVVPQLGVVLAADVRGLAPRLHVVADMSQRCTLQGGASTCGLRAGTPVVGPAHVQADRLLCLRLGLGLVSHSCLRSGVEKRSPGRLDVSSRQEWLRVPPPLAVLDQDVVCELCEDLGLLLHIGLVWYQSRKFTCLCPLLVP